MEMFNVINVKGKSYCMSIWFIVRHLGILGIKSVRCLADNCFPDFESIQPKNTYCDHLWPVLLSLRSSMFVLFSLSWRLQKCHMRMKHVQRIRTLLSCKCLGSPVHDKQFLYVFIRISIAPKRSLHPPLDSFKSPVVLHKGGNPQIFASENSMARFMGVTRPGND